ncbi:uncharacterized protein LOC128792824 [Vidua chalybeata]|uniref:uncharacterized protein LOC128792824 n=1 Tax=Vidua chalybeata TaxID=81927 RepID=UPI0023A7AC97|nr:uncharacterized protein LOC128792824 [Vidua chalybeata]
MAEGQPERVPPPPWGTLAAGRAQGTPSLGSRMEGLWQGSAARQGHRLPPVPPACCVPLGTGAQLGWKFLICFETKELLEVQAGHGGNTYKDLDGGLGPHLLEDTSMASTCTCQQSNAKHEVDAEPQEPSSASSSTQRSTEETTKCSELLSPVQLAKQSSASGNSQPWDTSVKDLEEKWEEEELPETQAAGDWHRDLQSVSLSSLKVDKVEAEACGLAEDPWDEGRSKLVLPPEPEECSVFSASPLSGGPGEERATRGPAKHAAFHKQLCMGHDDMLQIMCNKREELGKVVEEKTHAELFGDIFSSMGNEESPVRSKCVLRDPSGATLEPAADPSVPHSTYSVTGDAKTETQICSELVFPELLADLESDSEDSPSLETLLNELLEKWEQEEAAGERAGEVESPLSILPRDEELEPAATPPDSDLSDQGHSEPLSEEAKGFAVCAAPADAADEADAAGTEAGRAQAAPAQEKPCGDEPPAGACPAPAQPLARSVPACPAGSAAVPQPPAPRRWRFTAKRARRALRRLFSCSCLRGQPEE